MSGGHAGGGGGGFKRKMGAVTRSSALRTEEEDKPEDVEEPNVDKRVCLRGTEELAIVMQRFRTHKLATDGFKFGMTSAVAKALPYADLSKQLRDPELIKVMKRILHRVCVLTGEGVRTCPGSEDMKNVSVRVFLASFLVAYHPSNTFESINKLETELMTASVAMLQVFDELCLAIISSERGADLKEPVQKALNFPGVFHTYLKAFQAWKVPDEAKLASRITHALTALYQAEDHLVDGEADTPRLREDFRVQQDRLRSKLVQIAGEKTLKVNPGP
jgi:hypothetical protein